MFELLFYLYLTITKQTAFIPCKKSSVKCHETQTPTLSSSVNAFDDEIMTCDDIVKTEQQLDR